MESKFFKKSSAQGLFLSSLVLVLISFGCSRMEIRTDYPAQTNFSGFRTYNWIPGPQEMSGNPRIDRPVIDKQVRKSVEKRLAAKGYFKQVSGKPDFWVAYHAAVERNMSETRINEYYGYLDPMGPGRVETNVYEYDEGSLILDIVEPETRKLLWRGSALARLKVNMDGRKRQAKIDEAIRRILEKFPPE